MKHYYLIHFKFDGVFFRGVQIQPKSITVSSFLQEILARYLDIDQPALFFSSRLDAGVSAHSIYAKMILEQPLKEETSSLIKKLNQVMLGKLEILSIKNLKKFHFNEILEEKTYHYHFTIDEHATINQQVTKFADIKKDDIIKNLVSLYEAEIYTYPFSYRTENKEQKRLIKKAELFQCEDGTYIFKVVGKSFVRGQVRMMMGALVKVATDQLSESDFKRALRDPSFNTKAGFLVPAQGLILHQTKLSQEKLAHFKI